AVNQSDLFINATGLGMDGKSLPIPSDFAFPKGLLVADMTYCPAETPFLRLAREQGLQTVNGLGMLLYQAEKANMINRARFFSFSTNKIRFAIDPSS
ncbi:shikimate dehydrogenase family protein, partial [Streptococcus gordonii]|uniref:shikimate dehydrogenase family protein n=1 Tax=Streptococcus gordonii TaxID=1302 RepID=UPI003BF56703|nr:hypothetical protein [Streptococcus gordonii]